MNGLNTVISLLFVGVRGEAELWERGGSSKSRAAVVFHGARAGQIDTLAAVIGVIKFRGVDREDKQG